MVVSPGSVVTVVIQIITGVSVFFGHGTTRARGQSAIANDLPLYQACKTALDR